MIWQLGNHLLACGDSSDLEVLKKLIGSKKINMLCQDVPYGVSVVGSGFGTNNGSGHKPILNDDISTDSEYQKFTENWLKAIKPHLAPKNSVYIFNADKFVVPTILGLKATGGKFSQLLIWVKTQAIIGRLDYLPQHELLIYGWFGTHKFYKSKDKSILVYPKTTKNTVHPTMKPIGLLRRLILNSTEIGDIVFDGFIGSGSTLLACEQTHRKCIGVEIDPKYCAIAIQRWESLSGQKAVQL
jgi:DNA modification methylase